MSDYFKSASDYLHVGTPGSVNIPAWDKVMFTGNQAKDEVLFTDTVTAAMCDSPDYVRVIFERNMVPSMREIVTGLSKEPITINAPDGTDKKDIWHCRFYGLPGRWSAALFYKLNTPLRALVVTPIPRGAYEDDVDVVFLED